MHVFVPKFFDTGFVRNRLENCDETLCDFLGRVENLNPGECISLRWTKGGSRLQKVNLLLIARYWVTPFGTRKLRLQCHKIRSDGSIGSRNIILEKHNGRVIIR